ncbi:hypothetical protein FNF27_00021 [Cafeteria roenbergensis]|uniref:Uncharacterized protein n=1 Tax=Cafeteria roenbergensis TaxID=33653 RepID=A0A5A8ELF1_CAFRO|nr:hypothetical protein FNF27_00021 [Cafeteria roenbergensis]
MSDQAGRLRKNRETTGSAALLRRARAASGDASVSEGRRQEGRSAVKEAHGMGRLSLRGVRRACVAEAVSERLAPWLSSARIPCSRRATGA